MDRESKADHQRRLKRMDEIWYGPAIPHPIISCPIPSPPVQQVITLEAKAPYKITEVSIASPPIQQVISLKAEAPFKVTDIRILSPPVQEVIYLKAFPSRKIITMSVPSREAPIQQVKLLRIAPPMKLISLLVSPHTKPITNLSFFWNPKAKEMNKVTSPSKVMTSLTSPIPNLVSEYSFFWEPEEANEVVTKSTPSVEMFSAPIPKLIITCKVATASIEQISTMHTFVPNLISETRIPSAPIQHVTSVCPISPSSIVKTSITTPMPTKIIHCTSNFERKHQLIICKTKVTSHQMKLLFSGSCENKSHQMLHPKVHFCGTGWKRMREKWVLRQFVVKGSSQKSLRFMKDLSRKKKGSSRKNQKKSVCISSRKSSSKKSSQESLHVTKSPSRKEFMLWKR